MVFLFLLYRIFFELFMLVMVRFLFDRRVIKYVVFEKLKKEVMWEVSNVLRLGCVCGYWFF